MKKFLTITIVITLSTVSIGTSSSIQIGNHNNFIFKLIETNNHYYGR